MRADAVLEKGDHEGLAVWRRILRAVGDTLASEFVGGFMGGHWLGPLDWRQPSLRETAPAGPSFCCGCSS